MWFINSKTQIHRHSAFGHSFWLKCMHSTRNYHNLSTSSIFMKTASDEINYHKSHLAIAATAKPGLHVNSHIQVTFFHTSQNSLQKQENTFIP